ncbi:ResIII domain protein, partial [Spraguea lophii 42_110]
MLKEKSLAILEKMKNNIKMSFEEEEISEAHILGIDEKIIIFNCRDKLRIEERVMINGIECMILDNKDKYTAKSYKLLDKKVMNKKLPLLQLKNYFKSKSMERIEKCIKDKIVFHEKIIDYLNDNTEEIEVEVVPVSNCGDILNSFQQSAVDYLDNCSSYKIMGPPGTGKTKTVVEMIIKLLSNDKKIIVCAPSNTASDNILKRFINSDYYKKEKTKFFRLGSQIKGETFYNLENIVEEDLDFLTDEIKKVKIKKNKKGEESIYSLLRDKKRRKNKKMNELQENTKLVFSTIFSLNKIVNKYDYIIIDECYQASELDIILSTTLAHNFILVGDPYQLGPVDEKSLDYKKMKIPEIMLNEQYRMNELLIEFSNNFFYQNKIKSKK